MGRAEPSRAKPSRSGRGRAETAPDDPRRHQNHPPNSILRSRSATQIIVVNVSWSYSFCNELCTERLGTILVHVLHREGSMHRRAEQSLAELGRAWRAEPSRAEQSRAEPSRAEPSRAEPIWAGQGRDGPRRPQNHPHKSILCPP